MPGHYASHVSVAGLLAGVETIAGEMEPLTPAADMFPHTIRDGTRFPYGEREVHEAEGPMSRWLQGQELLSVAYPFGVSFEVYDPQWINDKMCYSQALDDIPSVTFYVQHGPDILNPTLAAAYWGAKCDRFTLRCAEHEPLVCESDWIAAHSDIVDPFSWTRPTGIKPFVWAGGTLLINNTEGDIAGFDVEIRHELRALYPMQGTLAAYPYDPKYIKPQRIAITANLRMYSDLTLDSPFGDAAELILHFQAPVIGSPTSTLTLTLSRGTFRNQEVPLASRDFIEYTVPMTFGDYEFTYS